MRTKMVPKPFFRFGIATLDVCSLKHIAATDTHTISSAPLVLDIFQASCLVI